MNDNQGKQWQELAVKAQAGDSEAYRELLTGLVPLLRRILVKGLARPSDADDIVQEVLCRLVMIGDDHFRVACAVFLDMRDGIVIGGNHFDCQNEI